MTGRLARRIPLPRRTVRLRLTLLYGSLFLVSGVVLLILINVLVRQTTSGPLFVFPGENTSESGVRAMMDRDDLERFEGFELRDADPVIVTLLEEQAEEFRTAAAVRREVERQEFLVQSGIALGVMAVASMGLGWVVAGRALRPLRTITAAAQDISATNLHRRLALAGPDDELKELGDTVDGLLERLERAFEAQRLFVANASHELRTPLARQRTLIEVGLADPDATVESLRAGYERVLASGEQQEQLIEALLTLARSERGLDHPERLDLAAIVGDVLAVAESAREGRGVGVASTLYAAPIAGDAALIERLATNLVDNAVRYSDAGGSIEVITGTEGDHAVLVVANSGPALSTEEVERMLEPFRRLGQDRVGRADGHGLGLSIVQAIVQAHGASLRAEPRPGGGLHVEVHFPPPPPPATS